MQDSVKYLGHIVDKNGISVSPKKAKGIVEMPEPQNQQQLRSFLGMVNHYGKFLCNLSDLCAPLNELLKKEQPWSWSNSCQDAFDRIKKQLISAEALTHYDPSVTHGVWKRHADEIGMNKANDWNYEHQDSDLPVTSGHLSTLNQDVLTQTEDRRYPVRERRPPDRHGF